MVFVFSFLLTGFCLVFCWFLLFFYGFSRRFFFFVVWGFDVFFGGVFFDSSFGVVGFLGGLQKI